MELPAIPHMPTEPGPMPDPCSGELDAIMLGEHPPTPRAIGRQWQQPADFGTWTNGNDVGPQHE